MFWWLMTPFIGRDLDHSGKETPSVDRAIERCAALAFEREQAARMQVYESTKHMFLSGAFGSTVVDQVRIMQLERENAALRAALESKS